MDIEIMRAAYPGKTDVEAAKLFGPKRGCIAVIRYKNSISAPDFTDIGVCQTESQVQKLLQNPYCHEVETVYYDEYLALLRTQFAEILEELEDSLADSGGGPQSQDG